MKFIKQVSIYTFVGVIGAGINFLIMPILSHHLSPTDYGILSIINTYVTILVPVIGICASAIISVEYFKQRDLSKFASLFSSIQLIPLLTTLIFVLFTFAWYYKFDDLLELKGIERVWGMIMLILTLLTIYNEQLLQFLVIQKKAKSYAIVVVFKVILEVSLTLYFVIFKKLGWEGRIYSWLITSIFVLLFSIFYFKKENLLSFSIKYSYIKSGIVFGAPLILHNVGKFVISQSDRIFIVKMLSIQEAGIYNIGYTVGSLIMIVINAFFSFYTPYLMEGLSDLSDKRKFEIVRVNYVYIFGILVILAVMSSLAPIFFRLFIDPRYIGGVRYVFWIGLGYVFWGGYMMFALYITYYNKNKILAYLALFNVASNLLFNYVFIKNYGAIGAAYATALSFFLLFIIIAFIVSKMVHLPWFKFKILATKQNG
jgi:O-antigen/teichoic acid export membrane protein